MMKEFTTIAQKFAENSGALFERVQFFCDKALSATDNEVINKLYKAGKKLYQSLSELEEEVKKEYIKDIKQAINNGKTSTNSLYNGLVELGHALSYAKQAVDQANTLLHAENLTYSDRKRIKKDITSNLHKVKEHGGKGISLIIEGVSLATKTVEQVKKISLDISGLFKGLSTSFNLFKSKTNDKDKTSDYKSKLKSQHNTRKKIKVKPL